MLAAAAPVASRHVPCASHVYAAAVWRKLLVITSVGWFVLLVSWLVGWLVVAWRPRRTRAAAHKLIGNHVDILSFARQGTQRAHTVDEQTKSKFCTRGRQHVFGW